MDALKKMGHINLQPHVALGTRFQTSIKNINALIFLKALMCMFKKKINSNPLTPFNLSVFLEEGLYLEQINFPLHGY